MHSFPIIFSVVISTFLAKCCFSQSLPPLLSAIKDNDSSRVNSLLREGANVSVVDNDSDNVLMYAALYSTPGFMKLLLEKGAAPDAKNKLGETAILWCSHHLEKTKLLLKYNADVNKKTKDGNTAFLVACTGNAQTGMIKLLLQHGADPLLVNNKKGTALMRVASYGDTAIARILVSKGVNINAQNSDKETALFFAIKSGNKEMVQWLLANGANPNIKDNYIATPLSYAVIVNDMEMVKALLAVTNGIDEQDIDGMSILMWAVYSEYDNPAIVQAVLDNGASLQLKDKKGQTALTWALKKGNTATVALLRKAGAQ